MKHRGVVYDVGLRFTPDVYSVEHFDPALVDYEMRVIAEQLHASAVRIEGEDIERLVIASRIAHAQGLTVYFNPWKMDVGVDDTLPYFAEAAAAAERLRQEGLDIVFVTGCELTIFTDGIFPGTGFAERGQFLGEQMMAMMDPAATMPTMPTMPTGDKELPAALAEPMVRLNAALASYVAAIRATFQGQITYAAGGWERVDWSIFDIVGVDHYRRGEPAEHYVAGLEPYRLNKPLAVTEVGCCAYEGAGPRGDGGFMVIQGNNPDGTPIWEGGEPPKRSESEQADYLEEQLTLLNDAGLEAAFVFCFSFPAYPHHAEDDKDLDRAAYGLVKTFADPDPRSKALPPWEPKEAFHSVAKVYGRLASAVASATS